MIESTPRFLRGTFNFTGQGYDIPSPAPKSFAYCVPAAARSQLIYFRAGNSSDDMINIVLLRDSTVMRYFPIGGRGALHVPLAVVEDLEPDQKLSLAIAAPAGSTGTVVVDIGLIEV